MSDRSTSPPNTEEIRAWLVEHLARALKLPPAKIDTTLPLTSYGLDSVAAITLSGDLEDWLGCTLPGTVVWDHPTIDALAHHLSDPRP